MATGTFPTGSVNTRKVWTERAYYDTISPDSYIGSMKSDGSLNFISDLSRTAGDNVKYTLVGNLDEAGFIGNTPVTGNEKTYTYYQDSLLIDQLRQAVQIQNKHTIDAQRVVFDLPEDAYTNLKEWMIERQVSGIFNQAAGFYPTSITYGGVTYTGGNRLEMTGMNVPTAPAGSNRHLRPNGLTTDEGVQADSSATLNLDAVRRMELYAKTIRPYIKPLKKAPPGVLFRFYVDHLGWNQILSDTTGAVQHRDMFLSSITAGKSNGAIGQSIIYSQTEIIPTIFVPNGVHSSTSAVQANVRRGVFMGSEAITMAYGMGYSEGRGDSAPVAGFRFDDDIVDVGQTKRIAISSIFGAKKDVFNSIDHGVIVYSYYAA